MESQGVLVERNILMSKLLWASSIIGLVSCIASQASLKTIITLALICVFVATVVMFLSFRRIFPKTTMYFIVISLSVISFFLIDVSHFVTSFLMIIFTLSVLTLYHDYRPLVLSSVLGLIMTNYFYFQLKSTVWSQQNLVQLNLDLLLIAIFLIAQSVIGEQVKKNLDRKSREAKESYDRIETILNQVVESTDLVKRASFEIAAGNQDLAQRTQEQSATFEQVTASINNIGISIQQVAANATQADKLSRTSLEAVHEGEIVIKDTMDSMEQIAVSSRQIQEIISVVNDVAFQTNLLALNAAVEAARAGERGRGFAVVAAEVRNLAVRTGESSKEIERLIEENALRVSKGNSMVRRTAELLTSIARNSQETTEVVAQVAMATSEQAQLSEDIEQSIQQLSEVTQQNAAMVEEISVSSQSLSSEAENLRNMVDDDGPEQFRLQKS